jgi:nitrogen fixation NifU-like protein
MRFSPATIERFQKTRRKGLTFKPHGLGMGGSFEKSQFVLLGLRCQDGQIQEARFESFNCISSIAAADWVCETIECQPVQTALAITVESILEALEGLPTSRLFCARITLGALQTALQQAQQKGHLPRA